MNIEELINDLDMIVEMLNSEGVSTAGWLTLSNSAYEIRKILQKQVPKFVALNHKVGDEVASVICPCCGKFTIIELEEYDGFDKDWYCKQCGQYLTLEEDEDNDFVEDFVPNCCDCEWTYNGGECDNCEWDMGELL